MKQFLRKLLRLKPLRTWHITLDPLPKVVTTLREQLHALYGTMPPDHKYPRRDEGEPPQRPRDPHL